MKKKHLTIDYKKSYNNGCVYSQTITINKHFLNYINKQVKKYKNLSCENKIILLDNIGISLYYELYIEELPGNANYIYLGLNMLKFIYYYLDINNYDISKIKYRNTRLKIKDL